MFSLSIANDSDKFLTGHTQSSLQILVNGLDLLLRRGIAVSTLLWWSLPILTLVIGTSWAIWNSKPRRSNHPDRDIQARRRFEQAVDRVTDKPTSSSGE